MIDQKSDGGAIISVDKNDVVSAKVPSSITKPVTTHALVQGPILKTPLEPTYALAQDAISKKTTDDKQKQVPQFNIKPNATYTVEYNNDFNSMISAPSPQQGHILEHSPSLQQGNVLASSYINTSIKQPSKDSICTPISVNKYIQQNIQEQELEKVELAKKAAEQKRKVDEQIRKAEDVVKRGKDREEKRKTSCRIKTRA